MKQIAKIILVLLFSISFLSACKSDNRSGNESASVKNVFDGENTQNTDIPKGYVCPPLEEPVCANKTTYKNACEATKAGEAQWAKGKCN